MDAGAGGADEEDEVLLPAWATNPQQMVPLLKAYDDRIRVRSRAVVASRCPFHVMLAPHRIWRRQTQSTWRMWIRCVRTLTSSCRCPPACHPSPRSARESLMYAPLLPG